MTTAEPSPLRVPLQVLAGAWLIVLPALRPVIWSGDVANISNLFYSVLLAAGAATGLLWRALEPTTFVDQRPWWRRAWPWGVAFLIVATLGAWRSPLPSGAWALVCGWTLHVVAVIALIPAIRRWPQLALAGIGAGLIGECAVLIGQVLWERPALQAALLSDPTLTSEKRIADQYAVRIASWRLEGSFLLANTLATYLLLVVPLCVALWWQRKTWLTAIPAIIGIAAFIVTGSKAAWLSALVIIGVWAGVRIARKWAVAAFIVGAAVVITVTSSASLRERILPSAEARIDYWRAAGELIAERPLTGHGVNGFELEYPRVKSPGAEETVLVHQEWLQAAVDLGLPAALLLLVWWVALARSVVPRVGVSHPAQTPVPRSVWIVAGVLLLFSFFQASVLHGSFAVYPGAPAFWSILFVVLMLTTAYYFARERVPVGDVYVVSVAMALLHVQADFSLHSMQVVGMMAWIIVLGHTCIQSPKMQSSAEMPKWRTGLIAVTGPLMLAGVALGVMYVGQRAELRHFATSGIDVMQRLPYLASGELPAEQREQVISSLEYLAARIVVEDKEQAMSNDPRDTLALGLLRRLVPASQTFPADSDLAFKALQVAQLYQQARPDRIAAVTDSLQTLLMAWPRQLSVMQALADHYLRLAARAKDNERQQYARQAQALLQRVVAGYPSHLPFRAVLIRAALITGDQATVTEQRRVIAELSQIVHPDNRLPEDWDNK